jgi:hypothetical protein
MAMTPEQLTQIRRELDADLERRLSRPRHMPEPREPVQSEARQKLNNDAWAAWANALIDAKLRAFVKSGTFVDFVEAVGEALGVVRKAMRAETATAIEAALAAAAEQQQQQIADAVRDFVIGALAPQRAELELLKERLAATEARLAAATGERGAATPALPSRWAGTA